MSTEIMADRISEFHDSILCHILSFLPTKHAATTSILSKRWKSLWLSVLTLEFDCKSFKDMAYHGYSVHQLMLLRKIELPILSFRFNCNYWCPIQTQRDVTLFVSYLMNRGIENLNIHNDMKLPSSILSCKTLKVLKLKGIIVNGFSHQVDFPVLKILHLERMIFERHELLVKLLSGCHILEELETEYLCFRSLSRVPAKEFDGLLPSLVRAKISCHDSIIPFHLVRNVETLHMEKTPTRPTHKAGKGISRRIESVASQKEVPGRKLKKAGNDIPTTSGTKSQIMMRLEKMVEESDIMHGAIRSVDFDEGVFGFAHSEIIAKEDMQQLFEHEELGIAVIHTYIWYMYVTLMRGTELCNRFNFIAASRINTTFITKNPTSVKNELVDRFMVAGDNTTPSLYFLPFNSGNGGH
ncbi:hypothetical protein KIW84_055957 [Lathyrus oleraceus]|uniref:Uncharacterized protein n=1 Tax=Pisum sativum TaxID=3888 RepID=A0A9D5AGC1_PEA|nr:hypothetical protein KIW84_055957 [Pisum sativum]